MRYSAGEYYVNSRKHNKGVGLIVCLIISAVYLQQFLLVRVAQSLIFFVVFCGPLFVYLSLSFGHRIFCHSIYGFRLTLGNLQSFLTDC
jgi:hypothetical protein